MTMSNDVGQDMDLIDGFRIGGPLSPTKSDIGTKESWLFKRSNRIASKSQKWSKEYVSLKGPTLRILKSAINPICGNNNHVDIKKSYQLNQYCTVSDIYIHQKKKGRKLDRNEAVLTSNISITSFTSCESADEEFLPLTSMRMINKSAQKSAKSCSKKTLFCIKIRWLAGKVYGETDGGTLTNDNDELPENVPELENDDIQITHEQHFSETAGIKKRRSPAFLRKKQTDPNRDDDSSDKQSDSCSNIFHNDTETNIVTDPIDSATNKDGVVYDARPNGIKRHYSELLKQQQIETKKKGEKKIRLMYLQKENSRRQKTLKRMAKGSAYATAASVTAAVSILTAGIGLAVGLVIVGATAAVGGTSAAVEMGYRKKKGSTTVVLGAATLDEAKEWKKVLEAAINNSRFLAECNIGGESDVGTGKGPPYYVSCIIDKEGGNDVSGVCGANLRSKPNYGEPKARWEPIDGGWQSLLGFGAGGLRIYREEEDSDEVRKLSKYNSLRRLLFMDEDSSSPLLRSQIIFNSSPLKAFMSLMSNGNAADDILFPNSGQRASFRILETIDENSDIIHLFYRPTYLFPFWTKARDFVLFRHWRYDSDKTYSVVYHSVSHLDCPPIPTHTRGKMDAIYCIAPEKQAKSGQPRCLLTQLVQVDAKGWIPYLRIPFLRNLGYNEVFAISTMSVALDIRDALDFDTFVSVSLSSKPCAWDDLKLKYARSVLPSEIGTDDPSLHIDFAEDYSVLSNLMSAEVRNGRSNTSIGTTLPVDDEYNNYDFRYSTIELTRDRTSMQDVTDLICAPSIMNTPAPCNTQKWAEPEANSFRVRGGNYMIDRQKINAGGSLFHLLAVDIYKVEKQMLTGVCLHPDGRMQMALAAEKEATAKGITTDLPPFVFAMNLSVRGPPSYNLVFFFGVDDVGLIDGTSGSPSSKLTKQFFFGDSDEFRDKTFKLIPQIVEGNFVVRKAARSTPVILGKKLKQYYCRSERYCEVTVDMGSSSVANGAIRLCNGFSKSIVVDLAFLLESNHHSMLPEKILGCVRLKKMYLPDDAETLREIS